MEADPEIIGLFLQESRENLERLERFLLDLEDAPEDPDLLAGVFRSMHTIKGTSGLLGFPGLESLAHAGEEVLARLREGQIRLSAEASTALLELVDQIRAVLDRVERTGSEGEPDRAAIVDRLHALLAEAAPTGVTGASGAAAGLAPGLAEATPGAASSPRGTVVPLPPPRQDASGTPDPPPAPMAAASGSDTSVRLSVDALDRIMDLTGELAVLRSRLGSVIDAGEESPIQAISRDLRVVTSDLQAEVMRSRLQPVGSVIGRFRRIARDLAHSLGKQVQVELTDEEVAVDRAINDTLRDPLLHLVRNAVDHGLESPRERQAAGKDPVGRLTIAASHGHGRVRIEVRDDGRGLDPQALRERAAAMGLMTRQQAETLTDRDAVELALRPGVSTAAAVTTVSGRGVGLDVVRSALGGVGGRVDIASEPGRGTCFSVNVPLTLAMLSVSTVSCRGSTYCLPQANVLEVRQPDSDGSAVTVVDDVPIYRLRGQLLPLVDLAGVLSDTEHEDRPPRTSGPGAVVIVETDERKFALIVGGMGDTFDVVVKPMPPETRAIPVFLGVSILADGQPALILDVAGLAEVAHVTMRASAPQQPEAPVASESQAVVLAAIPGGGRIAVRLADVVRLEHFDADTVKQRGAGLAVLYGDEILPLVRVAGVLPERRSVPRGDTGEGPPDDSVATIVCRATGRLVGLVVQRIIDVVQQPPLPSQPASRPGVIASIYLQDQFAELLDLPVIADAAGIESAR